MPAAEILSEEPLSQGYIKLVRVRVRLPDGAEVDREIESHGDAACVLPYDPERKVALVVSSPRLPILKATGQDHRLLEAPAGMLEGMQPEATVRKEAMEEAGLMLRDVEKVAWTWSSPGVSTERVTLFLAAYSPADRRGEGGGAEGEHENIVVQEVPLADLWAFAQGTDAVDLKTFALLQALRLRRPELFED
jgi:nudix-type nucleoside diphosphatase (YffH/AdpP family)